MVEQTRITTKLKINRAGVRLLAGLAAVAGAATLALSLGAAPASAATSYTVSGGAASETVTNVGNLVFTATGSSSKPKLTCTAFSSAGALTTGTYTTLPTYAGTSTGLTAPLSLSPTSSAFTGCTNPTLGPGTVAPLSTPWKIGCTAKTTSGSTVTGCTGYLYPSGSSNPSLAKVTATSAACSFEAYGTLQGTYSNATGQFTVSTASTLTTRNVTGSSCSLVGLANGQAANLTKDGGTTPAVFKVSTPFTVS